MTLPPVPPAMTVKLSFCAETAIAAQRAMQVLFEAVQPVVGFAEEGAEDARDLIRCEYSFHEQVLRILPTELYLELVAKVSEQLGLGTTIIDGWPVLSVVSPKATVAEGAASAYAAPEAGR